MPEYFEDRTGFSRRTVMRTAAWSVPVVVATVATPLAAASEPTPIPFVTITQAGAEIYPDQGHGSGLIQCRFNLSDGSDTPSLPSEQILSVASNNPSLTFTYGAIGQLIGGNAFAHVTIYGPVRSTNYLELTVRPPGYTPASALFKSKE